MQHGGKRPGAGRPAKEPTKTIRVPLSRLDKIKQLIRDQGYHLPLYASTVRAGFPSPADDFIEDHLDLNEYLIAHPAATFLVRAKGDSMINASIEPGDILVVDRSIEPSHGKIIIAAVDNELTVKRLHMKGNEIKLLPENPNYPAIIITTALELIIWGVVTSVIHRFD